MLLYVLTLLPLLTAAQYDTVTYNPDNDTYDYLHQGTDGEWTSTTTTTGGSVGWGGSSVSVVETSKRTLTGIGIGFIIFIVLIVGSCVLGLCCYLSRKASYDAQGVDSMGAPASTPGNPAVVLADKINFARKGVIDASKETQKRIAPRDGAYVVECDDSGNSSTTHMVFTPSAEHTNCWTVSGKGGDAFGSFNIEQGLVAGGGRAYWVEKDVESGRRVLSTGKFVSGAFVGQWKADSGIAGTYSKFVRGTLPLADAVMGSEASFDVPVADAIPVVIDDGAPGKA